MNNNIIFEKNISNTKIVNKTNIIIELRFLLIDTNSIDAKQYELVRLLITYSYLNYYNEKFISYNGNLLSFDNINTAINDLINILKEKYIINFTTSDLIYLVSNTSKFFKSKITKTFKQFLESLPPLLFFDFRFDAKVYEYVISGLGIIKHEQYFKRTTIVNLYKWINETNDYEQKNARIKASNSILLSYASESSILQLSGFKLTTLPENVFTQFTFVKTIDLTNNHISFISENVFRNMKSLTELDISQQFVELNFAVKSFEGTNLKKINIAYNFLKSVPKALAYLNKLENLTICSNQIVEIKKNDFVGSSNLKRLDIGFNQLEFIHPDAFINCHNLRVVNFRENNLSKLPTGLFNNLLFLEEISFFKNKITEIQENTFSNLPKLSNLILTSNRLRELSEEQLNNMFFNLVKNNINYLFISFSDNPFYSLTRNNIINFFEKYDNISFQINNNNEFINKLESIISFNQHNEIALKLLDIFLKTNENEIDYAIYNINDKLITFNFIDPITLENVKKLAIEERDEFLKFKFIFLKNSNDVFYIYSFYSMEEWIMSREKDRYTNPITKKNLNISEMIGGKELLLLLNEVMSND